MIIEKQPSISSDDAPPAYDSAFLPSPQSSSFLDVKSPTTFSNPQSTDPPTSGPSQLSPPRSPNTTNLRLHRPSASSSKGKGPASWFNFSSSRTTREVRATVLGLIRDLVRQYQPTSLSASLSILESCAEACTAYNLSLSSLLQERSIEDHTPLYWAIVKRPPEPSESPSCDDTPGPDLLTTLLSFSAPLSPETISEVRLACLLTSDQALFQRLRQSPEFSPLSGTDEMLLGASMPPDEITVEDVPGDEGAFAANFEIVLFQQRMRISQRIALEFIARGGSGVVYLEITHPSSGRMWCLAFSIAPSSSDSPRPGTWCLSLSLFENSPPTWIDSRLLIKEPPRVQPQPSSLIDAPIAEVPSPSPPPFSSPTFGRHSRPKPKPTISLRLKSGHTQLTPPASGRHRDRDSHNEIVVSLDDSLMGSSLQYAGSSYIGADGTLRARLEARLAKPEAECIIC